MILSSHYVQILFTEKNTKPQGKTFVEILNKLNIDMLYTTLRALNFIISIATLFAM